MQSGYIAVFSATMRPSTDVPGPLLEGERLTASVFGDAPRLDVARGWKYRHDPNTSTNPRRASRLPKFKPFRLTDAEFVVWVDNRVDLIVSPWALVQAALDNQPHADVWACRHRCRDNIYEEAAYLIRHPEAFTDADWPSRLVSQVEGYARDRWPRVSGNNGPFGLWEAGVLVWRNTAAAIRLGNEWAEHYAAGCERDQISLPVAAYNAGAIIGDISGKISRNMYFKVRDRVNNIGVICNEQDEEHEGQEQEQEDPAGLVANRHPDAASNEGVSGGLGEGVWQEG